jgi:hypothetical protein
MPGYARHRASGTSGRSSRCHPSGSLAPRYLARTARAGAPSHLLLVHLGEPHYAGHSFGWMSWLYRQAHSAWGSGGWAARNPQGCPRAPTR